MLSILIINWNTRKLLRKCLQSLELYPPLVPHEVIVVDNASTDGSARMVEEEHPLVRLVVNARNVGYAEGNNDAFECARGDLLLTLNPDTEVPESALQIAYETLQERPECGSLAVRLIGMDGRTQRSVRGFPTFLGIIGATTGLDRIFPHGRLGSYRLPAYDYSREGPAPQPMGTFLLFRRTALAAVGDPRKPFDEGFPIFFNEVDLLYRLHKSGWPCLYTPRTHVLHHGGESTKQVRRAMIWESHKSLIRYMRKHHGTGLGALGLPFLSAVLYLAAFVRAKGYHAGFRS